MNKQLQYYEHSISITRLSEALPAAHAIHELAADVQHIGAVGLYSEVQAGINTGNPSVVTVPNPVSRYSERRTPTSFFGEGKERHTRIASTLEGANVALHDLQTSLDRFAGSSSDDITLQDVAPHSRGTDVLRYMHDDGNQEMILSGADISPFLKTSKDLTAKARGEDPSTFSWQDWFIFANDEQLTNFSQWYTERLKILAVPESRAKFVEELKVDYEGRIEEAMQEGWVTDDRLHRSMLEVKMTRADIRFFSPFGRMPENVAGLAQRRRFAKNIIALPTLAGVHLATHELGHAFAGIDDISMRKYFTKRLGKEYMAPMNPRLLHLFSVLNEGYNDHMATALIDGQPTTIIPAERDAKGIVETEGSSDIYKTYREVFGVLMGGKDGVVTNEDIKKVVKSMVVGNFGDFAGHISTKWGGRDIMVELLGIVDKHDNNRWNNLDDPDYAEELLAKKIIEYLRG